MFTHDLIARHLSRHIARRTIASCWPAWALLLVLVLAQALVLGGCQSTKTPAPAARIHPPGNPNPSLVMLPEDALASADEFASWEVSRNDGQLGMLNPPLGATFGVAVIRQYENLGTSNGRARDNSWIYSRSIRTRMGP